jgi:hypothetical protein
MSFVVTQPESQAAASDLHAVGEALAAHNAAAATPTTGAVPAAADEVSALTATQFAMHEAVAIQLFTTTLAIGAGSYEANEPAKAIAAR